MCAQVYETVSNSVELGSDFDAGVTYTVRVNDEMLDLHGAVGRRARFALTLARGRC